MMKAETKLLIALVVMGSLALAFYVVNQKTLLSEITAAYVQAIGSIAAIFAAIWIDRGAARRKAEDDRHREADQRAVLSELATAATRAIDILLQRVDGEETRAISIGGLNQILDSLRAFPVGEFRDGITAMSVINVIAKGDHFAEVHGRWDASVTKIGGHYTAGSVAAKANSARVKQLHRYRADIFKRAVELTQLTLTARAGRTVDRVRARDEANRLLTRRFEPVP